jgi:sterol desaturase/sphingolipid hydroxylase (fatty acid hydroxylase superfamily)
MNIILKKLIVAFGLYIILRAFFSFLEHRYAAIPQDKERRRGFELDSFYWFFTLIVSQILSTICIAMIIFPLFFILGRTINEDILESSYGWLGTLPHWLQGLMIIFISDFIGYWTHRWLHTAKWWDIHAIHHSSENVDWLSSVRVHPINDIISRSAQSIPVLLLGFAPISVEMYAPFLAAYLGFVHANVPWNYGIFGYLITSPVYHRWHHSKEPEAIDKNFAALFPIFDLMFGTFYLPKNKQPSEFGLHGDQIPNDFVKHLVYPWRDKLKLKREIH